MTALGPLFMRHVEPQPNGCWRWTGAVARNGYGQVGADGRTRSAHSVAYERAIGPVPDGLTLDHLCHNADTACAGGPSCEHRRCVNPEHLEPVTQAQNSERARARRGLAIGGHCSKGHALHPSTVRVTKRNELRCVPCERAYMKAYRERRRQADLIGAAS